jgi:hypothetical protein
MNDVKMKYGDEVEIKDVFYKNVKGIVVEQLGKLGYRVAIEGNANILKNFKASDLKLSEVDNAE